MMYYSHKLQNVNPGVSWCVPGIEKAVKSILFTGLTFGTICGILINLNWERGLYNVLYKRNDTYRV